MASVGARRLAVGLVAAALASVPGAALARALVPNHVPRARAAATPKLYHMTMLQAASPAWIAGQNKLAFLGNRQAGGPMDLYIWEPVSRRLGRATDVTMTRDSLAAAPDGRLAYVERGGMPSAVPPDPACRPGQDAIVVYDFAHGSHKTVFAGGAVVAGSLAWSHDGTRIAFLTEDAAGSVQVAVLESGKPLAVTKLPVAYQLRQLVGWIGDHDVMAIANAPGGPEVLLRFGKTGFVALPDGDTPRLSSDGRLLLTKASPSMGVMLRGASGGGHTLNQVANAYAWGPHDQVIIQVGGDLMTLDTHGRMLRRYAGVAGGLLGAMVPSPDGRYLALLSGTDLSVLAL